MYKHLEFPMVGDNICRSKTAINKPWTGRSRRGRRRTVISSYRVWAETVKDEEQIRKERKFGK
jgi:hypothetical protein